jgi:hypothetical protein
MGVGRCGVDLDGASARLYCLIKPLKAAEHGAEASVSKSSGRINPNGFAMLKKGLIK